MPRKSLEAVAAEIRFARSGTPALPPDDLQPEAARQLWRDIIRQFPHDRFDAGSLPLLARYCRMCVVASRVHDVLDTVEIGSKDYIRLHKILISSNNSASSLAQRLRLTVQNVVDRHSAKLKERINHRRPWESWGENDGSRQ